MPVTQHSKEQHATALADYLPDGPLFEAKNIGDSNFRKLLKGFASELFTSEGYLKTLEEEYNPINTTLFLSEWEKAIGIPDDCFFVESTTNARRNNILTKLSALGIQTEADFVALSTVFGKTVTITSLADEIFPPYSVSFNPGSFPEARFIIVVTGPDIVSIGPPYAVPFDLSGGESVLECLMSKLKPSNCKVIFRNT